MLDILARSFDITHHATTSATEASEIARQAASAGVPVVYAFGGDGTARIVASGLLHTSTALGLLPAGTTNVLAASLGLPSRATDCAEAYARSCSSLRTHGGKSCGPVRSIDAGVCNGQIFLMMASRGFDARVLANTAPATKRRYGRLAIVWRGIVELIRYSRRSRQEFAWRAEPLTGDDAATESLPCSAPPPANLSGSAGLMAVCNISHYAGAFRLCRNASPDDGRLDVLLMPEPTRRRLLALAGCVLLGLRKRPWTQQLQAAELQLNGEGTACIQLDGDPLQVELPIRIAVHPAALPVLQGDLQL